MLYVASRDNDAETAAMLDNLRTHTYQALVLDAPVVSYLASTATQCDLYPVGELFETFNLAIAFPADAPTDLSGNISTSIVRLQVSARLLVLSLVLWLILQWLLYTWAYIGSLWT